MSSTNAPFGLKPLSHPSGVIRHKDGSIASGYATAIYKNSPVKEASDGTIQAAAVNDRFVGAFVGCEFTDTARNRRYVQNNWPASTVSPDAVCYYTADPDTLYAIQANGSIPATAVGEQADFAAVTGNSVTGISTATISSTTSTTAATLAVDGLVRTQDNAWGDSFTVVRVRIAKHQYVASASAGY